MDPEKIKQMLEKMLNVKYGDCNVCHKMFKLGDQIKSISEPWNQTPFDLKYCAVCVPTHEVKNAFQFVERKIDQNDSMKMQHLEAIMKFVIAYPEYKIPTKKVLLKLKTEKPKDVLEKLIELKIITKECYDDVF
jgi:hypothetical protein